MRPRFWRLESEGRGGRAYRCELCFHHCRIPEGAMGYCGVRGADESGFISPCLGRFASAAVDPIEKKPLYHWRPGTLIFSLGGLGCNMRCPFCQNHTIAQPRRRVPLTSLSPDDLAARVRELKLNAVAYTYNEPTLQAEYIIEAAPVLKDCGASVVLVSNGVCSLELIEELSLWVEAANVDLKSFNPDVYEKIGGSLEVVKRNVVHLVQAGVHVELTTLVAPGVSDDRDEFADLVEWIASISPDIPFHISRYFPAHTFTAEATDPVLLKRFQRMAEAKLKRVHLGNMP